MDLALIYFVLGSPHQDPEVQGFPPPSEGCQSRSNGAWGGLSSWMTLGENS